MMMNVVQHLSQLLVNKNVVAVELTDVGEGDVALFVLSDGTRFRIHATDLGAWVEETEFTDGLYRSLNALIVDYHHHTYRLAPKYNFDLPKPKVTFCEEGILELEAPDGRIFRGKVSAFAEEDQRLVCHSSGSEILASVADSGNIWTSFLNHKRFPDLCPIELSRV